MWVQDVKEGHREEGKGMHRCRSSRMVMWKGGRACVSCRSSEKAERDGLR
jgi:hypothetical protein